MSHDHHRDDEGASETTAHVHVLEDLLVERGVVSHEEIDQEVAEYDQDPGPMRGARVVARAWSDPEFKRRLLADGGGALAELGITDPRSRRLRVVENAPKVHNMIVCTLCSCYPGVVLGLPPTWYKSAAYRSRAVIEPRAVLREFGLDLADDVEVRVWDSSAELRYMVLPLRPEGTEDWSEEQLAALVTRDAMIGTALVEAPGPEARLSL
jgi:nitrile hydratase